MTAPPARRFATRVKHAIAFVLIVWGIAATFVAFEIVALSGTDILVSYPDLFGNIALSRSVTQSVSCSVRPGEAPARRPAGGPNDSSVAAWLLGVNLGRDAVIRQFAGASPETLQQLLGGRNILASRLGVPSPAVFSPRQMAAANTEFVTFVEQDASETAHHLAVGHSPQVCELFKLGAFWGYSEMVRPVLAGERAVFALEIRYHALRADVPEALWSPMLQRSDSNVKPDQIASQTTTLTDKLTTHLTGRR
jgi:hypothetical protein